MANVRIPQLPFATGIDGTAELEIAQPDGFGGYVSRRTTSQAIANLAPPGGVSTVVPGTYGNGTNVGQFTVDQFGVLTFAGNVPISVASGTVTSVSVVSANGLAGTVATATSTPAITLSTTVNGILQGDGTAISAASTTGTGSVVLATSPTLVTPILGVATATTLNRVTVTPPAAGSTLTIQDGFTLTVNANALLSGTNTGDQTITLTGDVTGSGTGSFAATIANNAVTLAKMATMTTASFLGRNTAGTGNPEVLSATTSTAILNAMVGDSGAGGTKGMVPAPAAGDAAATKFLKADGTWAVPAGTGAGTVNSVAVATANGFAGTVADPTNNAIITVKTTITGVLSGNGTAISAASTTGSGNVVLATSPTLVTPALGTPTAVVLTSGTGLPISTGVTGLGTGVATFLATPSSANLAAAVTDETGSGLLVFATSPTLTTPTIGAATATTINKVTITAPATAATLTLADGTTFTGPASSGTAMTLGNVETVTGAKTFNDGKLLLAGSSSGTTTLKATAAASGTVTLPAATDTLVGKATTDTLTNKTYDTAGTGNSFSINGVAVTTNTGTGAVVRATSPTLVTPNIGSATGTGLALTGAETINLNTAGLPTPITGTTLQVQSADGTSPTIVFEGNAAPQFFGRRISGTVASPSATGNGVSLLTFGGTGYDTGYVTTAAARMDFRTDQAWSAGARGTQIVLSTTPNGTTTLTTQVTINNAGVVNVTSLTASQIVATDASKNLVSVATTGSGSVVLATSPTLVTPTLGVATATSVNKVAITAPATSATLTIQDGKTLTYSEGTFTPAFTAAGATFSYATQTGKYTRRGNRVEGEIDLQLNTSGNTLAAANLFITALPFTNAGSDAIVTIEWTAATTAYVLVQGVITAGGTQIGITGITAAAVSSNTAINASTALHATNGSRMRLTFSYQV